MALNHRALQRTLFRMQHDPDFAARVATGDPRALRSTELCERELEWLRAIDLVALAADRGGARRDQLLRNVSGEFRLTAALLDAQVLASFPQSAEFHRAVQGSRSLPLALGRHLARHTTRIGHAARAVAALERAMARARRRSGTRTSPPSCGVMLSGWVSLLELPEGTLDLTVRLRESLESHRKLVPPARLPDSSEWLLLRTSPAAPRGGLREVTVEKLSGPLAELLRAARTPLDLERDHGLAVRLDASPEELVELAEELCAEGILLGAAREIRSARPGSGVASTDALESRELEPVE